MKILQILPLLGLLLFSWAHADDTDIYLEVDNARSSDPYLMLMFDYRPNVFAAMCGNLEDCVDIFPEDAYAKLCSLYTTTPEAICRTFYNDIKSNCMMTGQMQNVDGTGCAK